MTVVWIYRSEGSQQHDRGAAVAITVVWIYRSEGSQQHDGGAAAAEALQAI